MSASSTVNRAAEALDNPDWLKLLARVGYGAKGVVYVVLGALAVQGVAGGGPEGALASIGRQPFGKVALAIVAAGLLAYAAWRAVQSVMDPEDEGTDAKALGKRVGWFCSGMVYAALALSAARLALGDGGGEGGGAQDWTAKLLAMSFGQWLVAAVGVGVLLAGAHQLKQAVTAGFRDEFALGKMSATEDRWATRAGRAGHAARTLLYAIIGWFLLRAAWTANASEAGGLGEALTTVEQQPYGPWLLAVVGAGLFCYGLYCFVVMRYRKVVRL